MSREMKSCSQERLDEFGLSSLGEQRLRRGVIVLHQHVWETNALALEETSSEGSGTKTL